jgi:hypothetical protein
MKAYNLPSLSETANANPEISILTAAVHSGVVSQKEVARRPYKKRWNVDSVTLTF